MTEQKKLTQDELDNIYDLFSTFETMITGEIPTYVLHPKEGVKSWEETSSEDKISFLLHRLNSVGKNLMPLLNGYARMIHQFTDPEQDSIELSPHVRCNTCAGVAKSIEDYVRRWPGLLDNSFIWYGGRNYTLRKIAIEFDKDTDMARAIEKSLVALTIDLLARGKRELNVDGPRSELYLLTKECARNMLFAEHADLLDTLELCIEKAINLEISEARAVEAWERLANLMGRFRRYNIAAAMKKITDGLDTQMPPTEPPQKEPPMDTKQEPPKIYLYQVRRTYTRPDRSGDHHFCGQCSQFARRGHMRNGDHDMSYLISTSEAIEARVLGVYWTATASFLTTRDANEYGKSNEHNWPSGSWRVRSVPAMGELKALLKGGV